MENLTKIILTTVKERIDLFYIKIYALPLVEDFYLSFFHVDDKVFLTGAVLLAGANLHYKAVFNFLCGFL